MCSGAHAPTTTENALPSTAAEKQHDAKNNPPRNPEPIEIADDEDLT